MKRTERALVDAQESLHCATKITGRMGEAPLNPHNDISALRTAANQARQAAQQLDQLVGMLEATFGD